MTLQPSLFPTNLATNVLCSWAVEPTSGLPNLLSASQPSRDFVSFLGVLPWRKLALLKPFFWEFIFWHMSPPDNAVCDALWISGNHSCPILTVKGWRYLRLRHETFGIFFIPLNPLYSDVRSSFLHYNKTASNSGLKNVPYVFFIYLELAME